jgi:cell division protein FtsQ
VTATETRPVVRSQVEPRIVERRRNVLEARRRSRRNRWIALAVVVALVAGAIALVWSPVLDVDRVVVDGTGTVEVEQVLDAADVDPGSPLALVDLAAVRSQVRALPGVAAASVTREWPDTVRIVVLEEVPLVRVRSGGTEAVVASTGAVLGEADGSGSLPLLELPAGSLGDADQLPDELAPALVVYARMPEALRATLASGRVDDAGSMWFDLADGATVRFGPVQDVPAKLAALQAFLEQVHLECLDVLDVSTSRVTASRVPGCAVPAPTAVDDAPSDETDATGGAEQVPGDDDETR